MDDLYANAWNDPTVSISTSKPPSGDSWTSPALSVAEEEADLAAPSWSTGAGIHWDEPPEVSGLSWSQPEPDIAWGSSTYDAIHIAQAPAEPERPPSPAVSEAEGETTASFAPHSPAAADPQETSLTVFSSALSAPAAYSDPSTPPGSPDAFGTFESAFTSDDKPSYALDEKALDPDPWGSPWTKSAEETIDSKDAGVDEWESAKEQKAKQDRKVPPEVLAEILDRCAEFLGEIWPEPKDTPASSGKDAWRNDRRSGMEGVEGLESLVKAFLPPLTLKPHGHFGKTHIAKKMATSVRLTKNLPMTKGSPMSHYLAAKDSTAWETAVKQRKNIVEDDIPHGWRIVEKDTPAASTSDANKGKKPTGRLFSFWSRRESNAHSRSPSGTEERVSMHSTQTEGIGSPADDAASSSRRSQDSIHSARASVDRVSPTLLVSSSAATSVPVSSSTPPPMSPPSPSSHQVSYSDAPDLVSDPSQPSGPPAPSAVSRFFNRFSRRSSTGVSTRSPRSSLALSSDDLEFLSDIIPSVSDDTDEDPETSTRSLAEALRAQPLPSILPLPPQPPTSQSAKMESNFASWDGSTAPETGGVRMASSIQLQDFGSGSSFDSRPSSSSQSGVVPILQPNLSSFRPSRPQTPVLLSTSLPKHRGRSTSPLSSAGSMDKQPFFLPSPPSSRAQTPLLNMPLNVTGQSSSIATLEQHRPPSVPSVRSTPMPPSFAHSFVSSRPSSRGPAASSASTSSQSPSDSPNSPSSSQPLAELYPMAFRKTVPQSPATNARPSFILAPPPTSRPHSQPAMLPATVSSQTPLAKASTLSKPAPIAVDVFDDDEFSDFHSSTIPSSLPVPSSSVNTHSPFSAPLSGKSHASSALLPPSSALPQSSSAWKKTTFASTPSALEDDFSDFPSFNTSESAQSFDSPSFGDSISSENAFLAPHATSGFDISDAFSPVLRTPSPPRPPKKSPPHLSITLPKLELPVERPHKKSHTAEHQHTLSLMERAAARPGRWPAPPSPLPQALAFPLPISVPGNAKPVDLLGDEVSETQGEGMAASQSSPALLSPTRTMTGLGVGAVPSLPAPVSQSQSSHNFDPFVSLQRTPSISKPTLPATRPAFPATSKNSGLSAQDLSFFEGL